MMAKHMYIFIIIIDTLCDPPVSMSSTKMLANASTRDVASAYRTFVRMCCTSETLNDFAMH